MVEPSARVGGLSVGERQRVEIFKALYRYLKILILDEPTAHLPRKKQMTSSQPFDWQPQTVCRYPLFPINYMRL